MTKHALLTFIVSLGSFSMASAGQLSVSELERFNLQEQVPAAKHYDLRARQIVVPAGAKIPEHEHSQRAGIVYVISGHITEYRSTGSRELSAGDTLTEQANTVHRFVNHSDEPTVLLAFDMPQHVTAEQ